MYTFYSQSNIFLSCFFFLCHKSTVAVPQGVTLEVLMSGLILCTYCSQHAGCAITVLNDACLCAGKAHARFMTVFEDLSAAKVKTVLRMNANDLIIFNHGVIVYFCIFCSSLITLVET